ncbi:hypothetical protein QTP88_012196 [Uroleucon formosanum]
MNLWFIILNQLNTLIFFSDKNMSLKIIYVTRYETNFFESNNGKYIIFYNLIFHLEDIQNVFLW